MIAIQLMDYGVLQIAWDNLHLWKAYKGNRTIADLRYGGKDTISPSTQIFASIKG